MKKLRVVLIRSNSVAPDPPVEKVADALLKAGHSVTILAWDRLNEEGDTIKLKSGNAPIVRFKIPAKFGAGMKSFIPLFKFQSAILKWLKKHRNEYDVIHAFDFDTGLAAKMAAKRYRKKLIYHILDFYIDSHGLQNSNLGKIIKKLEFGVINFADVTIICTEKRNEQIQGSLPKKLIVIHNTPQYSDGDDGAFEIRGSSNKIRIVYVGILANSRFIREIADFVKQDQRFEFHIGGFGKMEDELMQYDEKFDNIFFYGKLPYNSTLALERSCDIMTAIYDPAIPNHRYAAPNKFYESIMLGKPVIMVKNTGFDDILEQNQNGILIDFSKEGLSEALNSLVDEKLREKMGKAGAEIYKNTYSWDIMEKRIFDTYANF